MEQPATVHTLSNGLKMVYHRRGGNVAYCGIAVNAGSRDDGCDFGLAHFVEHTIFKGTKRRRAWHILNRMELVGGELNAYTTKEDTFVYSVFPTGNMERAVELIADLVENSVFPANELEHEREVVLEEIRSYRDTPSEAVYDDFEDLIFAGHPLGHNILGTEESVQKLCSKDCRDFLDRLYVPENMTLFAVGGISTERMLHLAERHFSPMHHRLSRPQRAEAPHGEPFSEVHRIDSHQAHCVTGVPIFGKHDERKYAMLLLNNILGGPGMNSLLNVAIRERRGLAYTVESAVSLLTDCGLFSVYFGSDGRQADKCLRLVGNTIDRLAQSPLKPRTLDAAKKQYAGQLLVSNESLEGYALSMGKSVLNYGRVVSIEETTDRIRAVSADELREAAALLSGHFSTLMFL